ncbi:MAG: PASTA domain-containing protein [Clostridia bacterium]|nr:PASTA domain-containing protein [Clostridia bacterium]
MSNSGLCLGCMNPKGSSPECPKCGYIEGTPQILPALAPGTILAQRYLVGKRLSSNGEGITYIAFDNETGRKVTIREFLPPTLCKRVKGIDAVRVNSNAELVYRDYLSDFLEISRAVSRLADVPAVTPVLDIFECNNTAYTVYEYVVGKPLSELVRRAKRLTWAETSQLFMPLVSSMVSAHAIGLVHFGLNPENIIMTRSGKLMITGFGIPDARIAETELQPELFDGYSAIEQYALEGKKGKWTDVYSICAVMLFALTGKRPPDAISRSYEPRLNISGEIAENIPAHVMTALAGGLQVHGENRTLSMEQLRGELATTSTPQNLRTIAGAAVASAVKKVTGNGQRGADGDTPWYKNLSQLQYGLLSAALAVLVLGTIAVIIFLNVRDYIRPDNSRPDVVYLNNLSDSDVSHTDIELFPVPNFVGKEWNDKLQDDYYTFMLLESTDAEYSDDYKVGCIIRQNIEPGSQVAAGTPIFCTISLGSKMCAIPNIIGMTVNEASVELEKSGLVLGEQTEKYSDSVAAGRIIAITGASVGAKFERDSAIAVEVSLGPEG